MSFDVPKLVQSPGCDHGHDEESPNGRDIKSDILDGYIRTPEVFRVISGIFRSTRELREFAGEYMGLIVPYGNRGERPKGRRRAPPLVQIGEGVQPPFPCSSPPLSFSPTPTREGGVTPPGAPPLGRPHPPPP